MISLYLLLLLFQFTQYGVGENTKDKKGHKYLQKHNKMYVKS